MTELAQSLKAAAEKATPGPWGVARDGKTLVSNQSHPIATVSDAMHRMLADGSTGKDAEFIALANPANILALVEALEKAHQRIDELENDEVRQRLANAEHQLYMAELAKHNLKASRKAQFRKRRAAEKRIAELEAQNEYIRKRYQQLDLLIGKNILVMQAAIIEWQATGDAKNGLAWIYNTLFGPGELPDEAEKDAQAYFDRKYAPLDEELMALHKWFWEQSEAERAAAGINVEAE
ncbi:TPA: ead/Ea22-like family protein [Klebsiella pneumoniae]